MIVIKKIISAFQEHAAQVLNLVNDAYHAAYLCCSSATSLRSRESMFMSGTARHCAHKGNFLGTMRARCSGMMRVNGYELADDVLGEPAIPNAVRKNWAAQDFIRSRRSSTRGARLRLKAGTIRNFARSAFSALAARTFRHCGECAPRSSSPTTLAWSALNAAIAILPTTCSMR